MKSRALCARCPTRSYAQPCNIEPNAPTENFASHLQAHLSKGHHPDLDRVHRMLMAEHVYSSPHPDVVLMSRGNAKIRERIGESFEARATTIPQLPQDEGFDKVRENMRKCVHPPHRSWTGVSPFQPVDNFYAYEFCKRSAIQRRTKVGR